MPSDIAQKALKNKAITKKQYDKLPAPLLDKVAKHNKTPAKGGVKEVHKKVGKEAHKAGRPKAGSKVRVSK